MGKFKNHKISTEKHGYLVSKAVIKDNIPYCWDCGEVLGAIADYNPVDYQGEVLTRFIRFCGNPKCHCKGYYYANVFMEYTDRLQLDDEDVKEVSEDSEVI